jgi:lysophospholipase L1-like esterase
MKNKLTYLLCTLTLVFAACDVNNDLDIITEEVVPEVAAKAGSVDFSKYVAVGASFTAGYSDGAVFIKGQENSFPNILAKKFSMITEATFTQPLMNDNIGGLLFFGSLAEDPRLYFNGAGPAVLPAAPTTEITTILSGPFNNLGVPGAKSFHIVAAGYGDGDVVVAGSANPYFARMASSSGTTILADAMAQSPTFFTVSEIGGNDVLSYAVAGGTGIDRTGNLVPSSYDSNDITDPNVFADVFSTIINTLTADNAKGVVATVPSITDLPHFTTVPYNPVPLDAATAAAVNAGYTLYNAGIQNAFSALVSGNLITQEQADAEIEKRTILFVEGQNAVVLIDEDLTDLEALNSQFAGLKQYRQATENDLLVLPSSSFIGSVVGGNPLLINGVSVPLEDKWVLTPEEQMNIKTATDAYNVTIKAVAASKGLAIVDFEAILAEASTTGIVFGEYTLTTDLVRGGLVSLDGIHLTARGYALMANKFLEAIDTTYGSNFTEATDGLAKPDNYPTNYSSTLLYID